MIVSLIATEQTINHRDFEQILMREQIYKTPIEFHITMRIDVYQKPMLRGDKVEVLYLNGNTIKTKILSISHHKKLVKIIMIHEDYYKLMENLHKSKDEVMGETLENYISYDANCYLNFREILAKKGLIVVLDNNRNMLKKVHVTSWKGKEKKYIRGVFRKVDITLKPNLSHYRNNDKEETPTGTTRNIHTFYMTSDDIKGINKRVIPKYTVIASGFNHDIYCMDKIAYSENEYCVMGIQRLSKNNENFSSIILGRLVEERE